MNIFPLYYLLNFRQGRVATRGVERDLKHDFKAGMKRLMLRSDEPIENTILAFLTREGSLVHQNLMWGSIITGVTSRVNIN